MQNQKKAGQAEDWELSEEYYREDTGKKELRLEDFLEEEPAEADREGLAGADGLKDQLESMGEADQGAFGGRASGRSDCCHAWHGRTADQGYPGVHAVLPGG